MITHKRRYYNEFTEFWGNFGAIFARAKKFGLRAGPTRFFEKMIFERFWKKFTKIGLNRLNPNLTNFGEFGSDIDKFWFWKIWVEPAQPDCVDSGRCPSHQSHFQVFLASFQVETPTLSHRSPSRGSGVKTFVHTSVNVVAKLQGTIAQAGWSAWSRSAWKGGGGWWSRYGWFQNTS